MGQGKLKLILSFIFITIIAVGFQNCSEENFVTQGNGQPYEGLTPGGSANRDPNADNPDNTNGSNKNPMGFQPDVVCKSPSSEFLNSVQFGNHIEQGPTILVKTIDGAGHGVPWNKAATTHRTEIIVATQSGQQPVVIRAINQDGTFEQLGLLDVRYSNHPNGIGHETFECEEVEISKF